MGLEAAKNKMHEIQDATEYIIRNCPDPEFSNKADEIYKKAGEAKTEIREVQDAVRAEAAALKRDG